MVIVGNGNAVFAESFREEFELEGALLVDPELAAYRAAGLRRGRVEIASPRILSNAFRAYKKGARQTGVAGDPWQLGGVFVFAPGGELELAFRSREAGDHASPDEIEVALSSTTPSIDESPDPPSGLARAVGKLRALLDVSNLSDVDEAAIELGKEPVDILIHNAGLLPDERIESIDGLEITFATHVAGPHRLTKGLRSALERADGGRIIWLSSGGMLTRRLNLYDPQWLNREYDGVTAYAETKRAQVVLAELWAESLEGSKVCVNSMHPGWANMPSVSESLPRFHRVTKAILRTPAEGADTIVWLAASPAASGETGRFFFDREPTRTHWIPSTRESRSDRDVLWGMCEDLQPSATGAHE